LVKEKGVISWDLISSTILKYQMFNLILLLMFDFDPPIATLAVLYFYFSSLESCYLFLIPLSKLYFLHIRALEFKTSLYHKVQYHLIKAKWIYLLKKSKLFVWDDSIFKPTARVAQVNLASHNVRVIYLERGNSDKESYA